LDERAAVVTLHPTSPPGWERTAHGPAASDDRVPVRHHALRGRSRVEWHAGPVPADPLDHPARGRGATRPGAPGRRCVAAYRRTVDLPAILGGLYYDLAGVPLPVALDGFLALAGPDRLLYGSDFPFTPAAAVEHLAAELRRAPALRAACLGVGPDTPGAALFPRLLAVKESS
jgi:hypothetical protein